MHVGRKRDVWEGSVEDQEQLLQHRLTGICL